MDTEQDSNSLSEEVLEKDLSNYGSALMGVPFRINNKDLTVWRKTENGLVIYFHAENFWCNPPTDTSIEWRAIEQINKHGITYLREDYVDDYNKNQRHKDLEKAMERHRESMLKNKHLYPWLKDKEQS
jgi:hypothetical protein